jgi:hypothetical protein
MKQIDLHEKKLEDAKKSGSIGLEEYYEKEIENLRLAAARKREAVGRKRR